MQYLGGKARLAKKLVPYIERELAHPEIIGYIEPFMGGGNVFCNVRVPRGYKNGHDIHEELMALWVYVRDGGELPGTVTEADYARAKAGEGPAWWRGFVGFGCSFGGKWMGGFARGDVNRNYATNARNGLLKYRAGLQGAILAAANYEDVMRWAECAVIYCDPPYASTTGYRGGFDSDAFWVWARHAACTNIVLISEYTAPPDIPCIATFPKKMGLRQANGEQQVRTEKLFRLAPEWAPYQGPLA